MKVQYHNLSASSKSVTYTGCYMRHLLRSSGLEITPDADVILATVSDPDAWSKLRGLRKHNLDAIIVVGGFEAYVGEWILAYANYVVAGKGERFITEMAQHDEVPVDLPEVYSRDTVQSRPCIPFEDVDFNDYPLIKVRRGLFYGVVGLGCRGKCAFCLTAWAQPHRKATLTRIQALVRSVEQAKYRDRLTLVTNDYSAFQYGQCVNAQSVRVDDLLASGIPKAKRAFNMLHLGVEGFDEGMRRRLGKPVSNDNLRSALRLLKKQGYTCELFFISGLPGDDGLNALLPLFEHDTDKWPRIFLKFTTINPAPHTPLWTMSLRDVGELTQVQVDDWYHGKVQKVNRRIRTFPVRTPAREMWRTALRRCSWWQVEELGRRPEPFTSKASFLGTVEQRGLGDLIDLAGSEPLANSHIITPHQDVLARAANKWNLPAPKLRPFRQVAVPTAPAAPATFGA